MAWGSACAARTAAAAVAAMAEGEGASTRHVGPIRPRGLEHLPAARVESSESSGVVGLVGCESELWRAAEPKFPRAFSLENRLWAARSTLASTCRWPMRAEISTRLIHLRAASQLSASTEDVPHEALKGLEERAHCGYRL